STSTAATARSGRASRGGTGCGRAGLMRRLTSSGGEWGLSHGVELDARYTQYVIRKNQNALRHSARTVPTRIVPEGVHDLRAAARAASRRQQRLGDQAAARSPVVTSTASTVRDGIDSLAKMRDRCASTVFVDRPNARAIWRLVRPSLTRRAISISRAVRRSSEAGRCVPTVVVLIGGSPLLRWLLLNVTQRGANRFEVWPKSLGVDVHRPRGASGRRGAWSRGWRS